MTSFAAQAGQQEGYSQESRLRQSVLGREVAYHVLHKNTFHGVLLCVGMAILMIAIPAGGV
jgi:hypothetical protein